MPPDVRKFLVDPTAQRVEPFKVFDNVYFVGVCWVSAWLLVSPQGVILIDTLHEPHVSTLLDNIRKVGVDLKDIRYVLITHGHSDHAGGAYKLKPHMPNAKFVMTQRGWDEAFAGTKAPFIGPWQMIDQEIVVKDGDQIALGDTVVRVYETPGHSFGTASYGYDVRDGQNVYHAITVGGLGLNAIRSLAQVEAYVSSVKRLQALADQPDMPITVHLTTHPFFDELFETAAKLKSRKPGDANSLVDPAKFKRSLADLLKFGQERVEIERAKVKN